LERKEKKLRQDLILSIMSGCLLGLSFPPYPFPLLALVGFVPLLLLIERQPKHLYLHLYLTFFLYHCLANWWIGSWSSETDPYLLASCIGLAIVHPFFFMLPIATYNVIKKRSLPSTSLILFPFIWVSFEWLHSIGELAFPWLSIGYTQVLNFYYVQVADISGVWGVSFLVIWVNVIIYKLIYLAKQRKSKKIILSELFAIPSFRKYTVALALTLILPYIYGIIRVNQFEHKEMLELSPTVNVAVIQPNINPWRKWDLDTYQQIELHQKIQDSLARAVGKLDLSIWSETSITYISPEFNRYHNFSFLQDWINLTKTNLLAGFADFYIYPNQKKAPVTARKWMDTDSLFEPFNSAILIQPQESGLLKKQVQIYHKSQLTPFGERVPYAEYLKFATKWMEFSVGISGWGVGRELKNLSFKKNEFDVRVAPIICIESIFPLLVRNFVLMDANLISVITNDGWYDHTIGPEQHFCIAQMRAIENRRYLARCANTGVSGFIKPTGEPLLKAPQYKSIGIAATLPLLDGNTCFAIIGNFLSIISTSIVLISIIYCFYVRKNNVCSS